MHLLLVGLNYKTAPVEVREALALPAEEAGAFAAQLVAGGSLSEVVILSTCNRTEVYAAAETTTAYEAVVNALSIRSGRTVVPRGCFYVRTDVQVIKHLFDVAAGLDSLVIGEPQIMGQVRTANEHARTNGTAGPYMGQLFRRALEVGKRVRTETGVGAGAASISYAAVELARKIFGSLQTKTALLVGAGEMAELAARNLLAHGVGRVHVANRTPERAQALADGFGGEAHGLEALGVLLGKVDICITSTGAQEPIIVKDMVRKSLRQRRGQPLFIIDIAVPRNVDPDVHKLDGVFVYDIDDLQAVIEDNLALRREQAVQAESIVNLETERLCDWLQEQEAVPLVLELRKKAEQLVAMELERVVRRRPELGHEDRFVVQAALESLANKLLHAPTVGLRGAARVEGQALEKAAHLLGLSYGSNTGGAKSGRCQP